MGKSLSSTTRLQEFSRITKQTLHKHNSRNQKKQPIMAETAKLVTPKDSTEKLKLKVENPEQNQQRIPLSDVVSDCVKRWFHDTLKEAKAGDISMQVLVGQMYYNGYGITRDPNKGASWITKASRTRSSVWKISEKRPGYNASDSDSSDDCKEEDME
ncbi:hypothetical protein MKW94_004940 [Papaver nudicaule]|uniref:Sel1-like protein n=1 Tax=Papaver nudicaule TaxID=74823 RepID=A0AA41VM19_PAPNU|nr:hypothetical protein [Papaver nudicaule]